MEARQVRSLRRRHRRPRLAAATRGPSTPRSASTRCTSNHDGSYTLLRWDRGTFLTNAGQSPGACETDAARTARPSSPARRAASTATCSGKVTGGTFNPNATCPADCGFTDVWIATFFGSSATVLVLRRTRRPVAFDFEYSGLKHQAVSSYHHWYRQGPAGAGTFLTGAVPRRHRQPRSHRDD